MPITREELDSFHEYAVAKISNGGGDMSWWELLESWRTENPSAAEREEVNEIIRKGLREIDAGGGRPADVVMAELRKKYGLPTP